MRATLSLPVRSRSAWLALAACALLAFRPALAQQAPPASTPAPPAHPITLEQTREMFTLMGFNGMMQRMLHANLVEQRARVPYVPEDVWQDFESSFAKVDFVQVYLPVYQKYLSTEDAARAIEFYRTPAGRHTLAVMPSLMREIAEVAQQKGDEIGAQVLARHQQEIADAERKYQQSSGAPAGAVPQK